VNVKQWENKLSSYFTPKCLKKPQKNLWDCHESDIPSTSTSQRRDFFNSKNGCLRLDMLVLLRATYLNNKQTVHERTFMSDFLLQKIVWSTYRRFFRWWTAPNSQQLATIELDSLSETRNQENTPPNGNLNVVSMISQRWTN
jgi:hypothetical protein